MVNKRTQSDLENLGMDMTSSQMQVFRAILLAAGGTGNPVKFAEIASVLETLAKRKLTKAYIYRQLSDLEKSGLISKDMVTTPRSYVITESAISKTLELKRQEKMSESLTKKQDLTTKLNRLKTAKSQELALMFHKQLAGGSSIEGSLMIEGVENVRSAIIREFADGAKVGDLVRVLGHASTMAEGLGPGGVTELRLIQSGLRGVKVRGLLTPAGDDEFNLNLMAGHLTPMVEAFGVASKTGNIQLKFCREPIKTYRMLTLNEDKMLLYLTHAKESDMAALINRRDNPGLIDDAIKTFDGLWETSIDMLEIVNQMLQKQKS